MLYSAIIFGLLGSFHCVGMCGPIAFMLPVDRENNFKKISQIFLYHLGRLISYSIIGLLFGFLGKSFYLFDLQQQLSILVGIVMILVVIIPNKIFNKYNFSKPIHKILAKIKSTLGNALKMKTSDTFLTIGFLNGFLPCGLVYMAVFGSLASGNAIEGSLYMTLFGLGTIPLMTSAIYLGNFLSSKARQYITKTIPVFVIIMGFLFILRGLGLGIPYVSPAPVNPQVESNYDCT